VKAFFQPPSLRRKVFEALADSCLKILGGKGEKEEGTDAFNSLTLITCASFGFQRWDTSASAPLPF
jgi:hypothetical protein